MDFIQGQQVIASLGVWSHGQEQFSDWHRLWLCLQLYGTYWSDHTLKLLEITGDYYGLLEITGDY